MSDVRPTLFVFAGNNGSGKSTIRNLIGEKIGIEVSIDPDSLTRKYKRLNVSNSEFQAGKESITLIEKYLEERKSFSFETTLSGKLSSRQIKKAKENGFEIIMFFIHLDNIELNVKRVKQRVKSGGHHIPTRDILRRERRVKDNLSKNIIFLDQLIILDNTQSNSNVMLNYIKGKSLSHQEHPSDWIKNILKQIKCVSDDI